MPLEKLRRRATDAQLPHRSAGVREVLYRVPAGDLFRSTRIHAAQHALLGIMGEHNQADSRLAYSAFLLGLRGRHPAGKRGSGALPLGVAPESYSRAIAGADHRYLLLAVAGGVIFNAANLLLVVAIEIAGLAVAFPLGIGLALVIGVLLNYAFSPAGNVWLLFGGVGLVAIAIVIDAIAYRRREQHRTRVTVRGILLSLLAGVLMGLFYPLVARSCTGRAHWGPTVSFPFSPWGLPSVVFRPICG